MFRCSQPKELLYFIMRIYLYYTEYISYYTVFSLRLKGMVKFKALGYIAARNKIVISAENGDNLLRVILKIFGEIQFEQCYIILLIFVILNVTVI